MPGCRHELYHTCQAVKSRVFFLLFTGKRKAYAGNRKHFSNFYRYGFFDSFGAAAVIGVLAVIIALMTNGFWTSTFQELHKKALEFKPDGLWAKVSENATGGVMGLMSNLPQDEASLNQLMEEMNELNKSLEAQQAAN